MASYYFWIKAIHIISSTLLFGTGLGTAWHLWMSYRSGNIKALSVASRNTVIADWIFTATSGVIQPVTGLLLIHIVGYEFNAPWLIISYILYVIALACWLPVVWLQIQVRNIANSAANSGTPLPEQGHRYMKIWFILGWPAFISLVIIFCLMVFKPI